MENRTSALLLMFLASIVASFSGLLIRTMESASPDQINIYRSIFFTLVVALGFLLQNKGDFTAKLQKIGMPVVFASICLGFTGLLVPYALTMTTIANNAFAMSATPFITMALAFIFLNERISRSTIFAMAIASIGIILMVYDGLGSGSTVGNILALLVALGFSSFAVIVRAYRNIEMIPCLILAGLIVIAGSMAVNTNGYAISTHDLFLCMVWGVILSGIMHWVFVVAAKHLVASELTLFTLFEFALSPVWVWAVFNERPERMALIGGALVILSVGSRTILEFVNQRHMREVKAG